MTETIHGIEVSASSACHKNQKMAHRIQKESKNVNKLRETIIERLAMVLTFRYLLDVTQSVSSILAEVQQTQMLKDL
jgi:hypothetical protein